MYEGEIPFDASGNQLHYAHPDDPHVNWKPNRVYDGVLTIDTYGRGRSAAYFEGTLSPDSDFEDAPAPGPFRVVVFMKDFMEMVRICKIEYGCIEYRYFEFVKRGQNFGLRMYAPGAQ